jgi:hypothetical protein
MIGAWCSAIAARMRTMWNFCGRNFGSGGRPADYRPGLAFEATLIPIADQPRALPRAPTRPRSPASVILNPSQIARDARSKK